MARSPIGVAALSRPSMLADMFMKMAPIAGCPLGNAWKKPREERTDQAAKRIRSPLPFPRLSHYAHPQGEHSGQSPSETSKANAAWSNDAFMTSLHTCRSPSTRVRPRAIRNATAKKAIHIQLRTIGYRKSEEVKKAAQKFADTHYLPHLAEGTGRGLACSLGSALNHSGEILVVAADVENALTDGERDLQYILGKLLLEVAVADRAVGVCAAEIPESVGEQTRAP